MLSCHNCPGLIPNSVTVCPNCGTEITAFKSKNSQSGLIISELMRMISVTAGTGLMAVTLMACYGIAPCDPDDVVDLDDDGAKVCASNDMRPIAFTDLDTMSTDCDDTDPMIFPGADHDGDGFTSCFNYLDGSDPSRDTRIDCDDTVDTGGDIHPDAIDDTVDGIDQNCNNIDGE